LSLSVAESVYQCLSNISVFSLKLRKMLESDERSVMLMPEIDCEVVIASIFEPPLVGDGGEWHPQTKIELVVSNFA
jgi:hypothetical protein